LWVARERQRTARNSNNYMSIQNFIAEQVFAARLTKRQVLVVYDPERRYRDICLGMATEKRAVVDSSESSITSRAEAIADLGKLGDHQIEQLLVYVPTPKPLEDEDKQKDPFALYGVCGDVFPSGDGDNYLSLCLKAKPDHATQVRAVFDQDPNPSFAVIDAIGGGLITPANKTRNYDIKSLYCKHGKNRYQTTL
jgi:hypothetical protein